MAHKDSAPAKMASLFDAEPQTRGLYFVVLNYASPASPSQVQFTPGTGGVFFQGVIVCDLDGSYAAVADLGGASPPTPIYLFNVSTGTPALLGTYQSDQAGVTSISVSGTTVAAASTNDATITLVSFASATSPSAADTATGLGGGACVKLSGGYLAAGAVNGLDMKLFSVSGTSATALGTDNTTLGSISALGITSAATAAPQITVSPASLAYGTVEVNTPATQTLTLHNTGTAPLDVTGLGLSASSPAFKVSPSGTLPAITPGGSQPVTVTFTPSAVQSYSATLTMTTNDPSHHTVSVALSGAGGQPAVTWAPAALAVGTVVAGETGTASLVISNSGSETLAVTGISASPSVFTAAPAQASVPAKGSQAVTTGFAPAAATSYAGTLTFQTSDPAHPSVSVPLSGTGLSPAQPSLEVFAIAAGQLGRIWQVTAGGGWSPWDGNTWKAGAPQIAGSSAVGVNADGRLEVFGLSPDGHLGHTYQLTPQGLWSPWADIQPAMALSGPPRVLANADGRLEVFAIGTDGNLGHAFQTAANTTTSWSGWHDLGPLITTNPAVARNADGRLEVFAIALDGNLGHIWQNAASTTTNWYAWQDLGPAITSNPAVARNTDGSLEVFAVAPVSSGPPPSATSGRPHPVAAGRRGPTSGPSPASTPPATIRR
jgi:Abnormal spindle-like microcephaly-assoc'd, ASPM-SPD-2-Hydin